MTQIDYLDQTGGALAESVPSEPVVPVVRRRRSLSVGLSYTWLALVVVLAALVPLLPVSDFDIAAGPPRTSPAFGELDLLLGTDNFGRSILSRVLYGGRVSLVVGLIAGMAAFVIGTFLGLLAGYFGRWVDAVITYVTDALLAFPPLILLLSISAVTKPSLFTLTVGLTILVIPSFVRLSRANTIAWRSREFVRAARNMGATSPRIIRREILPNVLPTVASYLPLVIASLIVAEGSLSFLGLGIPAPTPSWGGMISDGKDSLNDAAYLVLVPSVVVFLTVFALNQIGDSLRARFDRTAGD
ncbi:ABC transporter permease [Blastococcus sp. TF02A-26]|uniref:ABC transporter permease n=1 Tax=Blastococcus sp. TF02A-26 TaxID=2250577 RepID=UPI000DEB7335|nr:ABC transporter permease [Blastococcus sp. TF02A-26]RBY84395.1 ABC transporter permease [Blastococcus sp. TF02A-26]